MTNAERKTTEQLKAELAAARFDDERLDLLMELRGRPGEIPAAEMESLLEQAVDVARRAGRHVDRADVATALANSAFRQGNLDVVTRWADVVREAAEAANDARLAASYQYLSGQVCQVRNDYDGAQAYFEKARQRWAESKSATGTGAALNALASLHALQGRFADSLEYYQECLKIDEELGDDASRAIHQYNAGFSLQQMGRWEDAAESFYRTIEFCEQSPNPTRGSAFVALGELYLNRDRLDRAAVLFEQVASEQDRDTASFEVVNEALVDLGRVRHRQGNLTGAGEAYEAAAEQAGRLGDRRQRVLALRGEAELAFEQGDIEVGLVAAAESVREAAALGLDSEQAQSLRVEALLHAAQGDGSKAVGCFENALALVEGSDDSIDSARVQMDYGSCLCRLGESASARSHLAGALRTFRKYGDVAEAQKVLLMLFDIELAADREGALLRAVSGLKALGLEPRAYLERALGLLRSAYGLAGAAVLVEDRPVVVSGSLSAAEPGESGPALILPLARAGASVRLLLESGPGTRIDRNQVGLDAVADLLASVVGRLVEQAQETLGGAGRTPGLYFRGVRGHDAAMAKVLDAVPALARESTPVVVTGEPGTGKGLVALALHESGPRVIRPWVEVDCSIPMQPVREAELFGREHAGRLETANGGTLYLREVGAADPGLQERLVTLIRDGRLFRVGSSEPVTVDLRIVAGTSQSLPEAAVQGRFSQDLLDLLSGNELRVPPLRERPDDIEELALHFIRRCGEEFGRLATGISDDALARLRAHDWPGNITELEAAIERAVLLSRGDSMEVSSLPPELRS